MSAVSKKSTEAHPTRSHQMPPSVVQCRKLKKIHNMYLSAKSEKEDVEREYEMQLEAMDEVYHELEIELQLYDTILGKDGEVGVQGREVKQETPLLLRRPLKNPVHPPSPPPPPPASKMHGSPKSISRSSSRSWQCGMRRLVIGRSQLCPIPETTFSRLIPSGTRNKWRLRGYRRCAAEGCFRALFIFTCLLAPIT